jgi:uncharacterized protein
MSKFYMPRVLDNELEERLEAVGAVLIVGPKWCGKTTTAQQHAKSVLKMQDPDKTAGYLATAQTKPSLLLIGDNPRLIDEWQIAPVLWDAIRTAVDEKGEEGLFILTGSTTVDKSKIMHSGTGRISRMMMRTMSLFESGESSGKISLKEIFSDPKLDIDGIRSNLSIEQLIFSACRGGWPSSIIKSSERASLLVARSYFDNVCENDIDIVQERKINSSKMRALLRSYARNISTSAANTTILEDINANFSDMSESTMYEYLNILKEIFVIDDIPAWNPSIRSKTSMRSKNKKLFVDPSIAVSALSLSPGILMQDFKTFGFIFENLCIRDLKVYSNSLRGEISYYSDRFGLEADAVLRLDDGRYALIEFKLGSRDIEEASGHLLNLRSLISKYNMEHDRFKLREPDLLIIITGGEIAYTREDGVKIIPIGCLKD